MGIDVDLVHNLASGLAAGARNDANRGKHVNQKGWVTKEEMRKDAAYKTIALLVLIFLATILFKILIFFGKLSIKIFGPRLGWAINVIGIILLVVIPVYTMKDAADKQKAEAEAAEKARQVELQKARVQEQENYNKRIEAAERERAENARIIELKRQADEEARKIIDELNKERMIHGGPGIDCEGIRRKMYRKYGVEN